MALGLRYKKITRVEYLPVTIDSIPKIVNYKSVLRFYKHGGIMSEVFEGFSPSYSKSCLRKYYNENLEIVYEQFIEGYERFSSAANRLEVELEHQSLNVSTNQIVKWQEIGILRENTFNSFGDVIKEVIINIPQNLKYLKVISFEYYWEVN